MGQAAARYADLCIVTSDNPRTENPESIIDEIMPGIPESMRHRITLRAEGIEKALDYARAGDVVLIAGKGHEDYQIIGTKKFRFSDAETVRRYTERKERELIAAKTTEKKR